ncbi:MAG: lipopolysaccharide biosynthesis protein [Actinomycetes bacterium]
MSASTSGATPDQAPPATEAPPLVAPSVGLAREMGRGALWLSVLTLVASGVNYLSNLVFSRLLEPASFGDLTALLALSVVVAVPTAAAQTRTAERVAVYHASGDERTIRYLVRHALAHLATLAVIATGIYVALIPLVVEALDLRAWGPAAALAPLIFFSFLFPVLLGTLQGLGRFVIFGAIAVAIAVARLAFGIPWVQAGGGSGGAIAGQALGMAACFGVLLWVMRGHVEPPGKGAAKHGIRRRPDVRAFAAGAAFVAFAVISNFDIVLAKVFLSPEESGLYAALATVGKVVTFLPAAVAVTMVPNAARVTGPERARVLRIAALFVLATTLVAAIPAALAPRLVIETMFGADYLAATSGVLPMVAAGSALSLLYLLVVFAVTIEDRRWTLLLIVGVVLQAGGIALFHDSPTQVAGVQAATVLLVLALNELLFHSLILKKREDRRA